MFPWKPNDLFAAVVFRKLIPHGMSCTTFHHDDMHNQGFLLSRFLHLRDFGTRDFLIISLEKCARAYERH